MRTLLSAAACGALFLTASFAPLTVLANLEVATRNTSGNPSEISVGSPAGSPSLESTSTDEGITATTVATTSDGGSVGDAASGGAATATLNFVLGRAIKFWHAIALKAQLEDYSHTGVRPQQDGPCYTSRMSAMVHLAIYDAYVGVTQEDRTYLSYGTLPGVGGEGGGGSGGGRRLLTWGYGGGGSPGWFSGWRVRVFQFGSYGSHHSGDGSDGPPCAWGWGCDAGGHDGSHESGYRGGHEGYEGHEGHHENGDDGGDEGDDEGDHDKGDGEGNHDEGHEGSKGHSSDGHHSPPPSPPPPPPPPPSHKRKPQHEKHKSTPQHKKHKRKPHGSSGASADLATLQLAYAAIGQAAYEVLAHGYSSQKGSLKATLDQYHGAFAHSAEGKKWGSTVAQAVLRERSGDGSDAGPAFVPFPEGKKYKMYEHQPDPFVRPAQPQYAPHWGDVEPFGFGNMATSVVQMPNPMTQDYAGDFADVKAEGAEDSSARTDDETNIGLMWAYDGSYKIGTPVRLFNQVVDAMLKAAEDSGQYAKVTGSALALAKLFACTNVAMADAAIDAWREKYKHNFWRPVIGIRWGGNDSFSSTKGDPDWTPLGSPLTNTEVMSFTPAFPSYPSGHATIGTAGMAAAQKILGVPDDFAFTWVSSEMDGEARGEDGTPRPRIEAQLTPKLAIEQNKVARVYLGVHWHFDCVWGDAVGSDIADKLVASFPARS